jgi:hypothetical protein
VAKGRVVVKGDDKLKRIPISRTQWLQIATVLLLIGLYFK